MLTDDSAQGALSMPCVVLCGRDADAGSLATLFSQHGSIESLRLLRDRGVAYVRYSRASSAAPSSSSRACARPA